MPTPFESAQLILTLYEQRREPTMRKARDFWATFNPETVDEYVATMFGPNGAYLRMVLSYWEMAASFVENGAIDRKMFYGSNMEFLVVFAKIEHLLPGLRERFDSPGIGTQLERLALELPDARKQIDSMKTRMRALAETLKSQSAQV
jgi:hypothetical protein